MTHKPPQGIDAPNCAHKLLKKQMVGEFVYYICECGQKFRIEPWDGKVSVLPPPAPQGIDAGLREALRQLRMTAKDARYDWSEIMGIRLSRLADEIEAAAPPDPRKDLALDEREVIHAAIADCCFGRDGTIISWLQSPSAVEERIIERLAEMRGAKRL